MNDVPGTPPVKRHLTALARYRLSQPVNLLMAGRLLEPARTFFDYGCGRGDDVRALQQAGIDATGWDPFHAPDTAKRQADLVNLGFVLNVIEDSRERIAVLDEAWNLTRKILAVSTLIAGQGNTSRQIGFRDGLMTSRGTFQKYFETGELRALVREQTGGDPVAIAPGIFFSFRDAEEQETYLFRRHVIRQSTRQNSRSYGRRSGKVRDPLNEIVGGAIEEIRQFALERGRAPAHDELSPAGLDQLRSHRVSIERSFAFCMSQGLKTETLDRAARLTREGLRLHYALSLLNGSRTAKSPSLTLRRDIRVHFGTHRHLMEEAHRYLHQLTDAEEIEKAIRQTVDARIARLDHKRRLVLHAQKAGDLPPILRLYLGSACYFLGEAPPTALIRLDPLRKRASFLDIVDWKQAFPEVSWVASVDLRFQKTAYHESTKRLLRKSAFAGRAGRVQLEAEKSRCLQLAVDEQILFENIQR